MSVKNYKLLIEVDMEIAMGERYYVLGTAGHIDHGKSALVEALTGIDPDRLKEEKERGITIELGFAHLALERGTLLGIVDVPGHERFVRQMVAGATGIDLVALVVAADEGVMPQTREHLDICNLLGVGSGLVVLTKIDLVDDPDWLDLVEEDIRDFLRSTFLEDAPIVRVSSKTGQGLEELKEKLEAKVEESPPKPSKGLFRLPVDRVFTIRGFGTVITGTLVSGGLRVGDSITVYPPGFSARVRGIQVHSEEVAEAVAGQRTAVNLQGVEKAAVKRGYLLADADRLPVATRVDVELNYLKSASKVLKNRARIRFHTFTSEVMAQVALLDREQLAPGETSFAQIITEEPVSVLRDDHFVIRSYSPVFTIGGGRILHPAPKKHRKKHHWVLDHLRDLSSGSDREVVSVHLKDAGPRGILKGELSLLANIHGPELDGALEEGEAKGWAVPLEQEPGRYLDSGVFEDLKREVEEVLAKYHQANPLKGGMPKDEIEPRLPVSVEPRVMAAVLGGLAQEGRISLDKKDVSLPEHRVDLSDEQRNLKEKIRAVYQKSGLSPPFFRDVIKELGAGPGTVEGILGIMVKEGELIKVKEDMFFHREPLSELEGRVIEFLKESGQMDTSQFKGLTGTSRKYTIPLAEYFDKKRVTIRVGDVRKLRDLGARLTGTKE